uniref:receptor protein serine/threonine kinase n=1 Tax=Cynoglossus semilaevis TaxID=244447 RepID=A0A3P8VT48_CYNSE
EQAVQKTKTKNSKCIFTNFFLLCLSSQLLHKKRHCVFHMDRVTTNSLKNQKYQAAGSVNGSVQVCENTSCCVGYFQVLNSQPVVHFLACAVAETSCPDATCRTHTLLRWNYTKCVCNTDLCNGNVTWMPDSEPPRQTHSHFTVINVAVISTGTLLVLCFLIAVARWTCVSKNKGNQQVSTFNSSPSPLCSCQTTEPSDVDIGDIELQQILGHGSFSTIWQGKYQGSTVAVKVLPAAWKQKFTAEKEVYELPLMKHAGILHFLGTGRKKDDGGWFIVLQSAECGSLCSFLRERALNWMQSLKMCRSLSQGLSYLHSDLHRLGTDMHKPPVAHRDLSSSNVLVKADGTCVLCDFGSSTILRSCSGRPNDLTTVMGQWQLGTLCYMAPEILEGAVNLHSLCSLKQGDIYALGLLLWEIWMRCSDLFDGHTVPQHRLPYESELEGNVTLESLIMYVINSVRRPSIPNHWKLLPQGSALVELLTDCWDFDPDARLTAQCVVDRLDSLGSAVTPLLLHERMFK